MKIELSEHELDLIDEADAILTSGDILQDSRYAEIKSLLLGRLLAKVETERMFDRITGVES